APSLSYHRLLPGAQVLEVVRFVAHHAILPRGMAPRLGPAGSHGRSIPLERPHLKIIAATQGEGSPSPTEGGIDGRRRPFSGDAPHDIGESPGGLCYDRFAPIPGFGIGLPEPAPSGASIRG